MATVNDSSEGRRLHAQAEDARESGDFIKALEYTDQATVAYQRDGDLFGLAEVQASRQSTLKHLFRSTGDPVYLTLEKHTAMAAVEIAELSGIPQATGIPYHNLGKYYFEAHEYEKAAEAFRKSIENLEKYHDNRHYRASVLADIKGHLYASEYYTGDKTALDRAKAALDELYQAEEPNPYNKAVWMSGGYLRMASMVREDDRETAEEYLKKAKEIIDANPDLKLRREQYEKVAAKFTS